MEPKITIFAALGDETESPSTSKLTLPVLAKKVKKLASRQFLNLKMLLNGRGFSKFKKYYKLKGEIGQGGFGIVYSAVRISDEMPVAVKFVERKHIRDWGKLDDERVPMEICMLARCSRIEGVIKLLDWYSMPEGFLIVMERPSPCIDLFDFIRRQKRLSEDLARFLFRQIVQTAIECAERKVLHRDLKDENVVIDLITGETRLIDFGAATLLKKTRYHDFQGTRLYCPPEWFLHALYLGKEAAVWSLGILLYNMLNGKLPFQNEKHICTSHLLGPLPFYTEVSEEARDLVCKCLAFDPFARPHLEKILNHPWFNEKESDWYNIAADISLAYPIKNITVDEEQQDEGADVIPDCEGDVLQITDNCHRESGVASGSNSFVEKQEQNNSNDSSPHEKPGTTIAKGANTMYVRRNAKTSVLHPNNCINYNSLASEARKKSSSICDKTKSGSIRPTLQPRTNNIVTSVDSGTSSFACNCSRDSLQSPLGSPLIRDNDCCQFPGMAPPEDCVEVAKMMDYVLEYSAWPGTLILTLATSIFVTIKIWKGCHRIKPPNGISTDEQSVELKDQKGVYKSGLLKFSQHDTISSIFPGAETLFEMFLHGMETSENGNCLGYRPSKGAPYKFMSFAEVFKKSREFGSGLLNHLGLRPGNTTHVGIYAKNSPEWFITCLANVRYSMVTVPLYDTLGADAASYIVQQTEIEVIVVDEVSKIQKLLDSASQMPSLRHIILIGKERKALEHVESLFKSQNIQLHLFEDIRRLGEISLVEDLPPHPDDVFIICYTSGTTGCPKGVMLSHRNICANCAAFTKLIMDFNLNFVNPKQIIISYLPLSHMFEQINHWCTLSFGSAVGYYSGDIATLTDDLRDLQPTIFPVVPRLLNRFYDTIQSKVANSGVLGKMIFKVAVSQKRNLLRERIVTTKSIWDKLVFNKIQQQVGGRVRLMITGSAPINSEVLELCRIALGAFIVEGYGQTEATAMTTCTWPGDPVGGHCGGPAPCSLIKLGDVPELEYFASDGKGEILIKGPCVTQGYFKNPEMTAELFDEEGFLKTGDIGQLLPTGGLKIIDRKKHIFKLAQGEYVAPEKIENIYVRSPLVQQAFVDGNSLERFLIAIIVPEPTTVKKWYRQRTGKEADIEEICTDKETVKHILEDITKLGKENKLNSIEQVKAIHLEPVPWTVENGLLTPTLKAKRPQLRRKYQDTIAALYKQI